MIRCLRLFNCIVVVPDKLDVQTTNIIKSISFAKLLRSPHNHHAFQFRSDSGFHDWYRRGFRPDYTRNYFRSANMHNLPAALCGQSRSILLYFAFCLPIHLLPNLPKLVEYQNQLQVYLHLVVAAKYLFSPDSSELSDNDQSVLQFFNDSETSLMGSSSSSNTDATNDIVFFLYIACILVENLQFMYLLHVYDTIGTPF